MTEKELKQIYYLDREARMWQEELERLQNRSPVKGQELSGMPFPSGTSDKVGDTATSICDVEAVIKGKLAEIQLWRGRILEYIAGIGDSRLRQIFFLRYINCMKWSEIADKLGGSMDAHRKAHDRYLEK